LDCQITSPLNGGIWRYWTVTGVEKGKAMAVDPNGERRLFGRQHAGLFDACE
jgi:hypothetical protein